MKSFKIFYSWQSDLNSKKTRVFIRECIDEAIDLASSVEAIEAERDEATSGTTGSPNIVNTLFSKIDDCNMFIADVSLCYEDKNGRGKKSPNPNVLLELGYAVRTLGWNRVICICNTDFGSDYPFDIAHNRITTYSLEKDGTRKEVKDSVSRIIFKNIRDLRDDPANVNDVNSNGLVIGVYDFETHKVNPWLETIQLSNQKRYLQNNDALLHDCRELVDEIISLSDQMKSQKTSKNGNTIDDNKSERRIIENNSSHDDTVFQLLHSGTKVIIDDKDSRNTQINRTLGIDVDEKFFDVGDLKKRQSISPFQSIELIGTKEEKEKYRKILKLAHLLDMYDVRITFIQNFKGMHYVQLAIQNVSDCQDNDIRIVIHISNADLISPEEFVHTQNQKGLESFLCNTDDNMSLIDDMFELEEDGIIHKERALDTALVPNYGIPRSGFLGIDEREKDEQDLENELEKYIAIPSGDDYYEFEIGNLRAGECIWLDSGFLIKPTSDEWIMKYQIYSAGSNGELKGLLNSKQLIEIDK